MSEEPTQEQWLIAVLALNKLRDNPNRDTIITEYLKSLPLKSDAYSTWSYVLKDRNRNNTSAFHTVYCSLYQDGLIKDGPWEQYVTPAQKKLVKKVLASYTATTEREQWFLSFGKHSRNINSDDIPAGSPINGEIGAGSLALTPEGKLMRVVPRKDPTVEIEITTWRGISIGAEHYYAKLKCLYFEPRLELVKKTKEKEYSVIGGLSDYVTPRVTNMSDITVRRPLTKSDLREAKQRMTPDRYECYDLGDYIDGFWTEEAAIEYATKTFNQIFDKNSVKLKFEQ